MDTAVATTSVITRVATLAMADTEHSTPYAASAAVSVKTAFLEVEC